MSVVEPDVPDLSGPEWEDDSEGEEEED